MTDPLDDDREPGLYWVELASRAAPGVWETDISRWRDGEWWLPGMAEPAGRLVLFVGAGPLRPPRPWAGREAAELPGHFETTLFSLLSLMDGLDLEERQAVLDTLTDRYCKEPPGAGARILEGLNQAVSHAEGAGYGSMKERAAVVAWLRLEAERDHASRYKLYWYGEAADAIERGDHVKEGR